MRSLFVVGTAGHIDHGKSALVKALTGIDPDRLEEEKRRGMTIDLGFAHFDLPSGRRAGIVVLNKIEMVEDPSWLTLVKDDVSALIAGTFLESSPIVEVSAKTGKGIPALVQTIEQMLDGIPARQDDAPVRLPVDRAFTMAGFGTIVTGTLWSGRIVVGDTLEVLPQGKQVRVRGVQSHGESVAAGIAGSRVAANLAGVEKKEITRGNVVCAPGVFKPTNLMDVRIRLLADAPVLPHLARIRLYLGSDEAIGRLSLLDRPRLDAGGSAVAQVRLETSIVAATGDPFVIRRFSPMITAGGGEVIDAHPPRRRRGAASATAIEQASGAGIRDRADAAVQEAGASGATVEDLMRLLSLSREQVDATLPELIDGGRLLVIRGRVFHRQAAGTVANAILREVEAYHAKEPWRIGMPKEELKTKAFGAGDNRLYAHLTAELVAAGKVEETGDFIRRPGFTPSIDPKSAGARERILQALLQGRFAPPGLDEIAKRAGDGAPFDHIFRALRDEGLAVEVAGGVFFHRDVLEEIKRIVADEISRQGNITVASLRDRLGTSRKYALTVLEYFDSIKLTKRVGDSRVLIRRA